MLLREFVGGDPPHACKLLFIDDPTGFGHRVTDCDRVIEHVFTMAAEFERVVAERAAEGFAETERSLTRRVFVAADRYWIVWLDGDTVGTQVGGVRSDWRESSGRVKVKEFRDRDRAVAAYHRAIVDKQAEGYREMYWRTVTIAETPKGQKKSGRRSRDDGAAPRSARHGRGMCRGRGHARRPGPYPARFFWPVGWVLPVTCPGPFARERAVKLERNQGIIVRAGRNPTASSFSVGAKSLR